MPTDTDIAYCAGIVDADGCIRVNKTKAYACQGRVTPGYFPRIQVRMVDEPAIKFIAETLGGWYYREKPSAVRGKPLYCWSIGQTQAETAIRLIRPYLRVKAAQADNALALRELQTTRKKYRTKATGTRLMPHWTGKLSVPVTTYSFSDEYVAMCESLYQEAKRLNTVGV